MALSAATARKDEAAGIAPNGPRPPAACSARSTIIALVISLRVAMRTRILAAATAGVLASSCVTYEPRPIDPLRTEALFRARSLTDPLLARYVEVNLPGTAFPSGKLDLDTLTLVGLYEHPDLDVARSRIAVAEAQARTAGARPNPVVALDPTYAGNSPAGISPWILGFVLDLPLETAGKRGLRVAEAKHVTEATRLDLAAAGWRVRSGVRAALLDHLLARREVDVLRAEEEVRSRSVGLLEHRLAAGEVSRPDVDAARTDFASVALAIVSAEGKVALTRAALASSLGLPAKALEGTDLDWPELDRLPTEQNLSPATIQRAGLQNRIDLRRILAEYAAAESALELEVAKQYPDVHLGPGYAYDQGENKFTIGFSLSLPVFNRNEGPIAAAEARRAEVAARFLALQAGIIGETEQALERYRSALAELDQTQAYAFGIDARTSALRRALEVGEEDALALAGAEVQGAVAARARLDALLKAQAALGALEDAAQRPLASSTLAPEPPERSPRELGTVDDAVPNTPSHEGAKR